MRPKSSVEEKEAGQQKNIVDAILELTCWWEFLGGVILHTSIYYEQQMTEPSIEKHTKIDRYVQF